MKKYLSIIVISALIVSTISACTDKKPLDNSESSSSVESSSSSSESSSSSSSSSVSSSSSKPVESKPTSDEHSSGPVTNTLHGTPSDTTGWELDETGKPVDTMKWARTKGRQFFDKDGIGWITFGGPWLNPNQHGVVDHSNG